MTEAEYARLLAIGYLSSAKTSTKEAVTLLASVEDPRVAALTHALAVLTEVERLLSAQASEEMDA